MRIERAETKCRACDAPVGVLLNLERYAFVADQHPGLVPMCDPCGERCAREFIAPSTLRLRRDKRRGGLDL
jgi:hypothetical protein